MSYCDNCILVDICGCESYYDESLKFCADKHKYIRKSELKDIKVEMEKLKGNSGCDYFTNNTIDNCISILNKHIKENKE